MDQPVCHDVVWTCCRALEVFYERLPGSFWFCRLDCCGGKRNIGRMDRKMEHRMRRVFAKSSKCRRSILLDTISFKIRHLKFKDVSHRSNQASKYLKLLTKCGSGIRERGQGTMSYTTISSYAGFVMSVLSIK